MKKEERKLGGMTLQAESQGGQGMRLASSPGAHDDCDADELASLLLSRCSELSAQSSKAHASATQKFAKLETQIDALRQADKELAETLQSAQVHVDQLLASEKHLANASVRTSQLDTQMQALVAIKPEAKRQHDKLPQQANQVKLCQHVCQRAKQDTADIAAIIQSHFDRFDDLMKRMNESSPQVVWWHVAKPYLFKLLSLFLNMLFIILTVLLAAANFVLQHWQVLSMVSAVLVAVGAILLVQTPLTSYFGPANVTTIEK